MARTRTSVGQGITVTLLMVLLLATFILSIVFYGQKQRAEKDLQAAEQDLAQVVSTGERNSDQVQTLLENARGDRQTLVGHLTTGLEELSRNVAGTQFTTVQGLRDSVKQAQGDTSAPLTRVISQRNQTIQSLERRLADAEEARNAAQQDLQDQVARLERISEQHNATVAALNEEIGIYKSQVENYRSNVNTTIDQNNARVDTIRSDAAELEASLRARISDLEEEVLIQEERISELQAKTSINRLRPANEYALVDARVIGTEAAQRQVYIDVGRQQRVVLGMTFEVYSDAGAIRPNDNGEYPRGKATVEVIRIDQGSSVCRVVRENRGNPIVVGDVLANAVYDPNKTYSFVVFGNFDTNRDGVATPQERNSIVGLIDNWGGNVVEDISGAVDFLVLGQRPLLPPPPPSDAPLPVIQDYLQRQSDAQEYDRLFQIATQTGIPVLNENRLYTLTGYTAGN
ncbi:MAG: hypothetical protein VYC34_08380 [Planctomycetota bacterium]|nr:hypothetical protein [Planctomycetota bacterium]